MIKFNKDLSWLKESDDENLLADDELDTIDEGLYVDPENYDDLVDVVDKEDNAQKTTCHTYNTNKDSDKFKDAKSESSNDIPKAVKSLEAKLQKYGLTNPKFTGRTVQLDDKEYIYELKVKPEEHQRIRKANRDDSLFKQISAFNKSGDFKSLPFKSVFVVPSSKQNDILIVEIEFK